MSEFKRHRLADLYEISSGISTTKDQAGHGAPFVAFKDIYNNYFIPERLTELMDTTPEQQEKFSVREGDVFLTRTSETLDELAMSSVALQDHPNATFSGFAKRLRPRDPSNPYPRFMGFFLRSEYFRRIINSVTTMTTRASFNEAIFSHVEVDLPDLDSQVQIGDLLYSIEQQIELNNQVNDNLHAMALSQFMHHFFRKEPNGELSDVLIELPKSQVQVRDAKDTAGRYPFFTSGASVLRWDESLASGRNLLLNTGGNADVKFYVGVIAYSTDTWAVTARDDLADYAYLLLQAISPELDQKYFLGTGLRHLQKQLLKKRPIYIPSDAELNVFNTVAVPAMTMISENLRENRQLQELRDWLLPMLMNGQATVASSDKLSFCVARPSIRPADNARHEEQFDATLYLLTRQPRARQVGAVRRYVHSASFWSALRRHATIAYGNSLLVAVNSGCPSYRAKSGGKHICRHAAVTYPKRCSSGAGDGV